MTSRLSMQQLTMADGFNLKYRVIGNGPDLILLHGWACGSRFFDPLIDQLSSDFRLWLPDMRGHGSIQLSPSAPTIEHLASDLAALIQHTGADKVQLLGWSMGAMVAFEYLRQFGGERIERLAVIDMTAKVLNNRHWQWGLSGNFDEKSSLQTLNSMLSDWPGHCQRILPSLFAADYQPSEQDRLHYLPLLQQNQPRDLASLWVSLCCQDYRRFVKKIDLPCLILHGNTSRLYPLAASEYLQQQIKNSQLQILENCGHAPQLEQPSAVAQRLTAFFSSQPSR